MESVLPAEPEPVQRMFENARIRVPFKAPLAQQLIRQSEELFRMGRVFAVIEADSPQRRGPDKFRW
jgi:hypothetical protein